MARPLTPHLRGRLASLCGLLFLALLPLAFLMHAAVGTVDGEPSETWADALTERGRFAQLSGYLHALSGFSLAGFVAFLMASPAGGTHERVRGWGRLAGLAWAGTFVLGGIIIFASAELAGYQRHPEGAKTALILGHLLYANPIVALLAGAFIVTIGLLQPSVLPAWLRPFSLALGALAIAVTLVGSVGGIGMVSFAPVALWLLVAAALTPWRTWRSGA